MPKTVVIIPTYNEAENLPIVVPQVMEQIPHSDVLIVDDNSPDGTGSIAEDLAIKYPEKVRTLQRPFKEGLGRAYFDAFKHVLRENYDFILQMDADLSHPPSLLPVLYSALSRVELALGSRYVPKGEIKNWGYKRKALSRLGNFYARKCLSLPVRDLTGGFKAYRRRVLEHIVALPLASHGYNFQIEVTAFSLALGFSWEEIPYTFTERSKGVSKMSGEIIWEAFFKTLSLRKTLQGFQKTVPQLA